MALFGDKIPSNPRWMRMDREAKQLADLAGTNASRSELLSTVLYKMRNMSDHEQDEMARWLVGKLNEFLKKE